MALHVAAKIFSTRARDAFVRPMPNCSRDVRILLIALNPARDNPGNRRRAKYCTSLFALQWLSNGVAGLARGWGEHMVFALSLYK